jgi:TldD protein
MTELKKTEKFFLDKFGLSGSRLERVLGGALGGAVDYADLYFEHTVTEGLEFNQGSIKNPSGKISQGVGIRVLSQEKTGYAFSDEISVRQLEKAALSARAISEGTKSGALEIPSPRLVSSPYDLYALETKPIDISFGVRAELLRRINETCRSYDSRIVEVAASVFVEEKNILVVSRDGWMTGDSRPMLVLRITCIASDGARRERGYFGGGGRMEYEKLLEGDWYRHLAMEAARIAIVQLSAEDAPAGPMTVVLGPGWPGILLHEAIGHGLEGDFNRKKQSAFSGRMGERVASDICTVVDNGTIPGRRGSLNTDDEGTPTRENILIDRGILVCYMQDKLNAKLMGARPTGNGRRESYQYPPMPRMTNTYMLPGESTPEDIIRSVKFGLYAKNFGGGQVDITNGKFVFNMSEAYLIEDGIITKSVKGADLVGDGPTALTRISMVGNDLALDLGLGTCGKNGQQVPVGVGIPTIRVDEITVGGTKIQKGGAQ